MLKPLEQRRKDLLEQLAALAKAAATDVEHRKEIDARAWRFVRRLELYRATGPLMFFESARQARDYLKNLRDDFRGVVNSIEVEFVEEVEHALNLIKDVDDVPRGGE